MAAEILPKLATSSSRVEACRHLCREAATVLTSLRSGPPHVARGDLAQDLMDLRTRLLLQERTDVATATNNKSAKQQQQQQGNNHNNNTNRKIKETPPAPPTTISETVLVDDVPSADIPPPPPASRSLAYVGFVALVTNASNDIDYTE